MTDPQQQAMPPLPEPDIAISHWDASGTMTYGYTADQMRAYAAEAVARALAASAPSREAPEGWKLVPIEPTREMLRRHSENVDGLDEWRAKQDWHNMLSAAPSTSGEGGKEGDDHGS